MSDDGYSSEDNDVQLESRKQRGGRPRNELWMHFLRGQRDGSNTHVAATCVYCQHTIKAARVGQLQRHLMGCKQATPAVKAEARASSLDKAGVDAAPAPPQNRAALRAAHSAAAARSSASVASVATEAGGSKRQKVGAPLGLMQTRITNAFESGRLSEAQQNSMSIKLLRWAIDQGIAFTAFDSPFYYDAMQCVRPNFLPPGGHCVLACDVDNAMVVANLLPANAGSRAMQDSLLTAEYARVTRAMEDLLQQVAVNLTLSMDLWTDISQSAVAACNVMVPHPQPLSLLLDAFDATRDAHTAEYLAGVFSQLELMQPAPRYSHSVHACCAALMKECCERVGLEKVAAMVTDGAANMKKARELLVKMEGCQHILQFGWVSALYTRCNQLIA